MTSTVEICNLALSHIGKGVPIQSLTEASEEARQCNLHYAQARDWLLQKFPYQFARKVQSLAGQTNDWGERWQYRFDRPVDCMKIVRVVPEIDDPDSDPIEYGIRGGSIYSNTDPTYLEYTFRQEDPSKFPAHFIDALSWSIAARVAFPLTRDRQIRADAAQMAADMRTVAEASDANNEMHRYDYPAEHIEARD
jgi:hypothetical protein